MTLALAALPVGGAVVRAASIAAPQGVAAASAADGGAVVTWEPVPGASKYNVLRNGMRVATVQHTTHTDWPAGRASAEYRYTVQAVNSTGVPGQPSEAATVTVSPALYPWSGSSVRRGPADQPRVALTFDDCNSVARMTAIVNTLRIEKAPAAFFCTGAAISRAPAMFADLSRDFALAGHTWSHPNLRRQSAIRIVDEMTRTTSVIEQVSGRPGPPIMRPPYGQYDGFVRQAVGETGLQLVLWDIDTRDWEKRATPASVQAKALSARSGSIILFHDRDPTVRALPGVIKGLRAKGLRIVPLGELLSVPWR